MGCAMRSTSVSAEPGEAPVLALESLTVSYPGQGDSGTVVRDVSLTVQAGECLGVVGESGAGKSQAFLAVMGLTSRGARVSGSIRLGEIQVVGAAPAVLSRVRGARAAMIFQNPLSSLTPHMCVGDQVAEVLVRHRRASWRDARRRALALLTRVHLSDPSRRLAQYPHELSGGMRQRVMIAMALAAEPQLLIADEPTTALDVTVQAQILALLAELKRATGLAIVLITHDLGVVAGLADRVAVMQSGRIVEVDACERLFAAPRHAYTRGLLASMPRLDVPPPPPVAIKDSLLQVIALQAQYRLRSTTFGRASVLKAVDGVSLELCAGEALGIVGESGSGKSTLVRAVLQLIRPVAGTVVWAGMALERLSGAALRPLRRDLQIVFQDPLGSLDPRMTAAEIVAEPLGLHRPELTRAQRGQSVLDMLARVGLGRELAARYPHQLSGGQCQRVGIARAMILQPKLLIADEPVSALDASIQQQIIEVIADLRREQGTSVLFVSHNLALVRLLCERVLVLYLGQAMEAGPTGAVYARPLHPYTRMLLSSVPIPDPRRQPARLLQTLEGEPPPTGALGGGCVFRNRCPHARPRCAEQRPAWERLADGRAVACHFWREIDGGSVDQTTV
jgi:oligopeptide/dipeptide ABC transporter ATP-binding protein